jgi:hypothetical protein
MSIVLLDWLLIVILSAVCVLMIKCYRNANFLNFDNIPMNAHPLYR